MGRVSVLRVLNNLQFVTKAMSSVGPFSSAVHDENLEKSVFSSKESRKKLNHSMFLEAFFFYVHSLFYLREEK